MDNTQAHNGTPPSTLIPIPKGPSLLSQPIYHTATAYAQLLAQPALQTKTEHSLHKLLSHRLVIAERVKDLMETKKVLLAGKHLLQGEIARRVRTQRDEE